MSASESDSAAAPSEEATFVERDDRETQMPFDKGKVPFYIAILWVGFIVVYVTVMAMLALPDLRRWMAH